MCRVKYTRMKRLTLAILKEHKGEKRLVECVLDDTIFNPMLSENMFWYLLKNDRKIYQELYRDGKIKKPRGFGEWVKDII